MICIRNERRDHRNVIPFLYHSLRVQGKMLLQRALARKYVRIYVLLVGRDKPGCGVMAAGVL